MKGTEGLDGTRRLQVILGRNVFEFLKPRLLTKEII